MALLEDVRAESERLHRLVEDLLVLSRVERGRLEVEAEPLEPRRLLERIVTHEARELPSISVGPTSSATCRSSPASRPTSSRSCATFSTTPRSTRRAGATSVVSARERGRRRRGPRRPTTARASRRFARSGSSSCSTAILTARGPWPDPASACSCAPASSRRWAAASGHARPPGRRDGDRVHAACPRDRRVGRRRGRASTGGAPSGRAEPPVPNGGACRPAGYRRDGAGHSRRDQASRMSPTRRRPARAGRSRRRCQERQRDDRLDEGQRIAQRRHRELSGDDGEQPDCGHVDPVEERPRRSDPRNRSRIGMLRPTAMNAGRKTPTVAATAPAGPPTT